LFLCYGKIGSYSLGRITGFPDTWMLSVVRKGAAAFSRVAKSPCQSTQNCLASQSWRFVAHEVRVISFKKEALHPCHRAAANTPPECPTASVSCGGPCRLRPLGAGSVSGAFGFSRPPMRSLSLRPNDSLTIQKMALSIGFIRFVPSTNAILATGS
jgi:hypothetical protein